MTRDAADGVVERVARLDEVPVGLLRRLVDGSAKGGEKVGEVLDPVAAVGVGGDERRHRRAPLHLLWPAEPLSDPRGSRSRPDRGQNRGGADVKHEGQFSIRARMARGTIEPLKERAPRDRVVGKKVASACVHWMGDRRLLRSPKRPQQRRPLAGCAKVVRDRHEPSR